MPETTVNTPNGPVTVSHPEGATDQQILSFARQQAGTSRQQPTPAAPRTRRQEIESMTFREKLKNDLGILADSAIGAIRGVPQAFTDVAGIVANPVNATINMLNPVAEMAGVATTPGQPLSTNVSSSFGQLLTDVGVPEIQTGGGQAANELTRIGLGFPIGNAAATRLFPSTAQPPPPQVDRVRQRVMRQGQEEGLTVTPGASGTRRGGIAEGYGGNTQMSRDVSIQNIPRINQLAARAIGVNADEVTPDLTSAIRNEATQSYRVIRGAGQVVADDAYRSSIDDAVSQFRSAGDNFQTLATQNQDIINMADDLRSAQNVDADAVVDTILVLRDNASSAFRNGQGGHGNAYKQMASALEDLVERNLTQRGDAGKEILDQFRRARSLIAKTHAVEDALVGGNVNANALAGMLRRGVPLTDELRSLGEFAREFPQSTKLESVAQNVLGFNKFDALVGLGSLTSAAATGNPLFAAPAIYELSRPAVRAWATSPAGQRFLTQSGRAAGPTSPGTVGGMIGAFGPQRIEYEESNYRR